MPKKYILCVDDEKSVLSSLKHELGKELRQDFKFEIAESGDEGLAILRDIMSNGGDIPLVISDQLMPGMKGDQFLIEVNKIAPKTRKIMLTGQADAVAVGNAVNKANLFRFISKPWNPEDLLLTVKEAINGFMTELELRQKVQLLTNVNHFSEVLASSIQIEVIAQGALEELAKHIEFTRAVLVLYRSDGEAFSTAYQAEKDGKFLTHNEIAAEEFQDRYPAGVFQSVMANRAPVQESNAQTSEWAGEPVISAQGIKTLYCAPIIGSDGVIGALYLDHSGKKGTLDTPQYDLLAAVVKQLGLMLQHLSSISSATPANNNSSSSQNASSNGNQPVGIGLVASGKKLPQLRELKAQYPESFVYYKPAQLMGGAFYWLHQTKDCFYIACGQAFSGAMPDVFLAWMVLHQLESMMSNGKDKSSQDMLSQLSQSFGEVAGESAADGRLQISLCILQPKKKTLQFSGADLSALIVSGGDVQELVPDRRTILAKGEGQASFQEQTVPCPPGTLLYVMTDGILQQMDAEGKNPFGIGRMKDLVKTCMKLELAKQENAIKNRIDIWRGKNEQTEDLLIIGLSC
jgi:CheY-like chemotaxis protein